MVLIGWAIAGIVLGAAGSEFLRAKKPDLIEKVENSARRFAESLCSSKSKKDKNDAKTSAEEDVLPGAETNNVEPQE